jgi:acyl-CoA reductase-like NAD-dependent aldehyde dehydrogenase
MPTVATQTDVATLPAVEEFLAQRRRLVIDGELRDAITGRTFETLNPSTGMHLADVSEAGPEDIDAAVAAARAAMNGSWRRMSGAERGRLLNALASAIADHADEFAQIESLDTGKPVAMARARDIEMVIAQISYFAGWPSKLDGRAMTTSIPDTFAYTLRQPVGVVGAIVPWNFPLSLACWKVAPALAAGCTVVLKPAEQTPLSALRLGELALEVGFPPGVLNVCPGFGQTAGARLVAHPAVDKIAFTGSVPVGKEVGRVAAETVKHVSLELGGKSPNIVLPDCDIDQAATVAGSAIFFNAGQVCSAPSRLMVHEDVYDRVLERVVEVAENLKLGPGLAMSTTLGALVSAEQLERVGTFVGIATREGAFVTTGGPLAEAERHGGYFYGPTVLEGVTDEATVAREEIFGPVLVAQRYCDVDEAVRRANAGRYGLAAGVWTSDIRQAHRIAAALEVGTVWINCWGFLDPHVPFGGYKESGYGRDNGPEAIEKFLQVKSVWTNLA